ncbi:MAG: ferrous iron transport protein A [Ignavibacteria bacterium CG_4_8_14_3_um_filter_37_9]|nr:ferrous iron transport protein A [Ignavibacteria bacterium]OIO22429.1 MAG: ferrous iron transport protein A [Ignavibacteria bacterium CG1_02_37_35]PIS43874.1 MAG: ferrous iron transport protein A [Ignavibacteria bacterium CG08_land_8_20_14_0_20_37_9]PIW99949.1 MAG: ferrous iron transport protein A [Ignavibacteria bacterium CG_4_8_14_3_um_filter_37_9]PIX93877.1 MAG: ferrous iron transport protein A [Ignavibacteria bacterium CG_4_10_14_3_um_filter_37_18]PJC58033.1 MAG: ferrous iron transport 
MGIKTLDTIKKGTYFTIEKLPSGIIKVQLIRLGISVGDTIFCLGRLPGGTIIVQKNRQEIAIGYELARSIFVKIKIT